MKQTAQPIVQPRHATASRWINTQLWLMTVFALVLLGSPIALADFLRGDVDGDGDVDAADLILLEQAVGYQVTGGSGLPHFAAYPFPGPAGADLSLLGCPDKSDVNDDGKIDYRDVNYLTAFLQMGGAAPKQPYPVPGADPSKDGFACGECFVAGNQGSNGKVWRLRANQPHPSDDLHLTAEVISNSPAIFGVQELAVVDYNTLVSISKPSGRAQTNYIGIGGAISAPIHLGVPAMTPPALGVSPAAITVDALGNFVTTERADTVNGIAVAQYATFNPMAANPLSVAAVHLPAHHPAAVRQDLLDPNISSDDVWISLESDNTGRGAVVVKTNPDGSRVNLCDYDFLDIEGSDLTIDRETGVYYFSIVYNAVGEMDQVRTCYQTAPNVYASGLAVFENELTGTSTTSTTPKIIAIDQMPALGEDLVVIALKGGTHRMFRVTNSGSYDVVAGFELNLGVTGITDVICVPDH